MNQIVRALLDELAADPEALRRFRELVGDERVAEPPSPRAAYTVRSLAEELGRSPRSIRGAIDRGELEAVKRGRGYVISSAAVDAWTRQASSPSTSRGGSRPRRRPPGTGAMRRGLAHP